MVALPVHFQRLRRFSRIDSASNICHITCILASEIDGRATY